MSKEYLMYMHGGSGNHGCEAIVNSLCHLLRKQGENTNITVLSNDKTEDERYSLPKYCKLLQEMKMDQHFVAHVLYYIYRKVTGNQECFLEYRYQKAKPFAQYDMAISIGGDNYCYDNMIHDLIIANRMFSQKGIKTVLLGCSIEPELLKRKDILEDMRRYQLIISRESITTEALHEAGIDQVVQLPDPAFYLEPEYRELPEGFEEGNTIGINVSPMIMDFENAGQTGIVWDNYVELIKDILQNTKMQIALIPHVIWERSNDRVPMEKLYELFNKGEYKALGEGRLVMIKDGTCSQLKGDIARCRFFVGARTHATIAAYSTTVPTLVAGYSVKSIGIARDLFGTEEGYVVDVRNMTDRKALSKAFLQLQDKENDMKMVLQMKSEEYRSKLDGMASYLEPL